MRLRFIWVGKAKDNNWRTLQDEYLQRLSHFMKCEVVEIRDSDKQTEGNRILEKLNQNTFVCALEISGKAMTSQELAKTLENWQNKGIKEISFIIGGADGLSGGVAERADLRLSLSFLTFTHEMARVVMLEQLYRACTIIKGFPYQR
jgi:23S rRNA (pseudouridine1915-N3)-methyltransferase